MKTITMLLRNDFVHDDRVTKEVETLESAGFKIKVLHTGEKKSDRLSPMFYPKGKNSALYFPFYLAVLTARAILTPAQVYHAHDLDTLIAGYIASRAHATKLVYDSHEVFTEMEVPFAKGLQKKFWQFIERRLIGKADIFISTNEWRRQWFEKTYTLPKTIIIDNLPKSIPQYEKQFNDKFTFMYQGAFSKWRSIDKVIEAFSQLDPKKAELILIGNYKKADFEVSNVPGVILTGYLSLEDISEYEKTADVGLSIYMPHTVNAKYPSSNKIFRYLQNGMSVIASESPCFERLVKDKTFGMLVDSNSVDDIKKAMQSMVDNKNAIRKDFKKKMKLIEDEYTWEMPEKILIGAYNKLIG